MEKRWLLRETIDRVFADAKTQADYIIGLYQCVYPDEWDYIDKLQGWPTCNKHTWMYICHKAQAFDETIVNPRIRKENNQRPFAERQLEVMPGGAWMNSGFATDESLADWEVMPCEFSVKTQEPQ